MYVSWVEKSLVGMWRLRSRDAVLRVQGLGFGFSWESRLRASVMIDLYVSDRSLCLTAFLQSPLHHFAPKFHTSTLTPEPEPKEPLMVAFRSVEKPVNHAHCRSAFNRRVGMSLRLSLRLGLSGVSIV